MTSSTDCHPCLPKELLAKLESEPALSISSSYVFKPDFEKFRLGALRLSQKRTCVEMEVARGDASSETNLTGGMPGFSEELMKNMEHFRPGDGKTFLHSAARDGDVPLAYEIIRMGIIIDYKDREGATPLFLAMEHMLMLSKVYKTASQPGFLRRVPPAMRASLEPEYIRNKITAVARIVTLLIEQHADVNAGAFGYTPLSLAVEAGQWALVELLLRHGAQRPRLDVLTFSSSADKLRFSSILKKTKAASPRPARPCPCWSGKLLSECHDASQQPYPDDFLCGCGKHRTYGACCGKRGIVVEEQWDPQDKWIMPVQVRTMRMPDIAPELVADFAAGMKFNDELLANADAGRVKEIVDALKKNKGDMLMDLLRTIGREDAIDPGFLYAMNHTDFFPRPWEGQISKVEGQKRMNDWNKAVDRYILSKDDQRSRFDIELEAKIGPHGGPLYRHCEAEGCNNVEQRDVDKMKCCSSCKLIFYCSQACQVKNWKEHKQECKGKAHRLQQLFSQQTTEQLMTTMQVHEGMTYGQSSGSDAVRRLMPGGLAEFD